MKQHLELRLKTVCTHTHTTHFSEIINTNSFGSVLVTTSDCVTTPARNSISFPHRRLEIHLNFYNSSTAANQPPTADATAGLHKTLFLHKRPEACRTHQGPDLTAVRHHNQPEWTNVHLQWRLALWRSVLFTDDFRFTQ